MDERARASEPEREPDGLRFGVFEVDLRSGELRRSGVLLRLAPQPFQLLALLARSRGQVLTREEIRKRIWGDGTFVDFDQRLNSCVNQVRQALSDDADAPRFIETLPKRGYRWLAATEALHQPPPRPALHVVVPFGSRAEAAPSPTSLQQQAAPAPLAAKRWSWARRALPWTHALFTVAVVLAAVALYMTRPAPNGSASWRRVTHQRGAVLTGSFAPGGEIVYNAAWEGGPAASYVTTLAGPDARALPALLRGLRVSRQGEAAFFRMDGDVRVLSRVPLLGGAPRDVEKNVLLADWMPDAHELAIVRDAKTGPRVELPIGNDIGGVEYVSAMRVSPNGQQVALLEHPFRGDDGGYVLVMDRAGGRHRLTGYWSSLSGLAWAPRGGEVWFTGSRGSGLLGLQAVSLSGKERTLIQTGARLLLHDVDAAGRVLLDSGVSRIGVRFGRKGGGERELGWFDSTGAVELASDGSSLLFIEGGDAGGPDYAIYVRATDGAPPVRLGTGRATALSPDGQWVLAVPVRAPHQIELIPTGPGRRRILKHDGFTRYDWAGFAGDSRHVLFVGMKAGSEEWHAALQDIDGGAVRPLGKFRLTRNVISPDGAKLVKSCEAGPCVLEVASGEERPLALAGDVPLWWDRDGRHLFVRQPTSFPALVSRVDTRTGARAKWLELAPSEMVGVQRVAEIVGTPDGSAYAYNYFRRLSDLFVVEGLR